MPSKKMSIVASARKAFHQELLDKVLFLDDKGIASNADKNNKISKEFALNLAHRLGNPKIVSKKLKGQISGALFEEIVAAYVKEMFGHCSHLRPGEWEIVRSKATISSYEQYSHLSELAKLTRKNAALATVLGRDYLITPDVLIIRHPEPDSKINAKEELVDSESARLTPLRVVNNPLPILHASASCKWTIRSDRAQNARSEALNLIRNRKGKLPHIVVVTGEVFPSRLASIAMGTGDIDCVYHFALPELRDVISQSPRSDYLELVDMMAEGKRLRDISDLVFDLII